MQLALIDNELKLYANRTLANTTDPSDPAGNRTAHPYICHPPTSSCPPVELRPWEWQLYNLSVDPGEAVNLAASQPELLRLMKARVLSFGASVIESQGAGENKCARNFGPPPDV